MASEDLDAMVALKLSSQDIDLIAGETTAPRVMSRRKRQSKSGAKQVGHHRLDTTAHYVQVATDVLREVISPLDALTSPPPRSSQPS